MGRKYVIAMANVALEAVLTGEEGSSLARTVVCGGGECDGGVRERRQWYGC